MSRGEENIHIYRIELEPYESGTFYSRDDGILTLITDREFPYQVSKLSIVSSSKCISVSNINSMSASSVTIQSNTSIGAVVLRKNMSYTCGDRLVIPTFGIRDEEWESEIAYNTIEALHATKGLYDDEKNYSVFITRKKYQDDIWETGLAVYRGYGSDRFVRNKSLEGYVNHLMDFDEL